MSIGTIVEIQGIPCDNCEGAGFVMLHENGDVETIKCNCVEIENEYFVFGKENN
jgi:uncharacterized protein (AIM24 family)